MKRLFWWISLLLLFASSNNVYSQIDDWLDYSIDCYEYNDLPDTSNRDVIYNSIYGRSLSPHDTIRMLVVFAEFVYTDTIPDPSLNWNNHYWDAHSLPRWADSLFAAYDTTNFRYKRVTRYYQYASSNDHIVLGDYLLAPDNGGVFSVNTTDGTAITSNIVQAVNHKLGNYINTANGLTSINDFDMWTSGGSGIEKPKNSNGKWDYVVFVVRNSIEPKNPNGGSTSSSIPLLGFGIDKACIVCVGNSKDPTHVIRHEYAHMLLGGNKFHTCGGGWAGGDLSYNYWIPQTGGWALLGLYGSSLMCWNAWDRYRLGWKGIGNTYDISARASDGVTEVNGDISSINGNGVYVLRDFVTSGDALRIKLPFIDEEKEYPEWIWLENHQGVNNNNVEFDKWQYQDADCVEDFEPGLMAYIQINSDIRESTSYSAVFDQYADYLNPLTANGFWDRRFLIDPVDNNCVSYARVRPFLRIDENPLTGCGDQSFYSFDLDGNDTLSSDPYNKSKQDQLKNWTEKAGSIYHKNLFQLGHSSHSFNLNGNKKIGIGTNPSSAPLINMVGQKTQCANAKNLRKTYLNGISIEILEQNTTNGNITVGIRFDDVDVENDVRWCSDSIVLNNIPTATGYSLNIKPRKTVLLDRGLNATRMTNPVTLSDGQKVFTSPTTFIIQPDVNIHLDTTASMVLVDSSKLHMMERSSCVVENQGTLEVGNGTVLQLDDCASLVINGTGMLIVERGAELRISPTAKLAFQNGSQNLFMEQGVIIPNGYANPNSLIANTISNVTITGNTTWYAADYKVYGNIVVESGATLNITASLLRFDDYEGHIIVKQGGRLIIDGSTLKSSHECSDIWQGIEVWGNSSSHQFEIHGAYQQGYLEMKNGATIENALCAVRLWGANQQNSTGGIIHATDAVFRNNVKAVDAKDYSNYLPATYEERPYNGWFRNCEFIIDNNYIGGETFCKHVDITNIDGMSFEGCDFSVSSAANNVSSSCMGIGAYSAGFTVTSYCTDGQTVPCPANNLERCTFTGFNNGILSVNEGNNARTFSVYNAVFTNNNRGVFANNSGYATILNNDFIIGRDADCCYGIYATGVTGFCIEENTFGPATGFHRPTYGIGIFNSDGINDIYRNTLSGLTCGNLAYGDNCVVNGGSFHAITLGLTYSCNDNTDNLLDFCVLQDDNYGGIAQQQGSGVLSAGNTFDGDIYHFYNGGNFGINYYYNSSGTNEIPSSSKTFNVNAYPVSNANDCDSHYFGGGVVRSIAEKEALAGAYNLAQNEYENLREQYEELTALGITPEPELISMMAQYAHNMTMAAGDIIRSDLNDVVSDVKDLRQWLGNMYDIASDRMIVASYIHEGDFANAFAVANTLPAKYNLQGNNLSDYGDYLKLLNLYQDLYKSGRTMLELTKEETDMVSGIAKNGIGASQLMAQNILMEINDRSIEPYICPDLPRENRGQTIDFEDVSHDSNDFVVTLSPMPVSTWVSVDYKLPQDNAKATMTIINPFGVKAMEVELAGNKGTKTLDLRNLANGVYTYIVRCGESVKTGKLVVTR